MTLVLNTKPLAFLISLFRRYPQYNGSRIFLDSGRGHGVIDDGRNHNDRIEPELSPHGGLVCLTLGLLNAAASIQAAPITAVTAGTNMGNAGGTNISQIVDGSGLSAYLTSATHATGQTTNDWIGKGITGTITFDLGGLYTLDGMAVWNFNAGNTLGVNALTVTASTDGVAFSSIAGAPLSFLIGANHAPELAQFFAFSTTASFIRFTIVHKAAHVVNADNPALCLIATDHSGSRCRASSAGGKHLSLRTDQLACVRMAFYEGQLSCIADS